MVKFLTEIHAPTLRVGGVACLVIALVAVGGVRSGASKTQSQNGPRLADVLVKRSGYRDEPVQIIRVKNKKGKIGLGKSFKDDPTELLREFTITINNTSGKEITHLEFSLKFPRPDGDGALPYTFLMMYGVSPMSEHYAESRRLNPDKKIKKGEEFDFTLSAENYDHIIKVLDYLGYPPEKRTVEFWLIRFALALALIVAVPKPTINVGGGDRAQSFGQRSV